MNKLKIGIYSLVLCSSLGLSTYSADASAQSRGAYQVYDSVQSVSVKLSQGLQRQLQQNGVADAGIALTNFVDADTLASYPANDVLNGISHALTEGLMTEMNKSSVLLHEIRGRDYIQLTPNGAINLSRKAAELNHQAPIEYILVGTLARRPHGVMVHTRVINRFDQAVVAAASEYIPEGLYWANRQVKSNGKVLERETSKGFSRRGSNYGGQR